MNARQAGAREGSRCPDQRRRPSFRATRRLTAAPVRHLSCAESRTCAPAGTARPVDLASSGSVLDRTHRPAEPAHLDVLTLALVEEPGFRYESRSSPSSRPAHRSACCLLGDARPRQRACACPIRGGCRRISLTASFWRPSTASRRDVDGYRSVLPCDGGRAHLRSAAPLRLFLPADGVACWRVRWICV